MTAVDRQLIVELAAKYKHVLENKRTDSSINEEKTEVWMKISEEFNAVSVIKRDVKQLKQV